MPDTTVLPLNEKIQQVAEQAMQLAFRHIETGQVDQAAVLLRALLDMHPGHAQAQYQLGLLEWQAQRFAEAAAHLSGALQANPGEGEYWLSYIEVLLDATQLESARATIDLGRRHGLDGPALEVLVQRLARAERGEPLRKEIDHFKALIRERRLDEAEQTLRAILKDCPRYGFGWKTLGVVYHMRGQITPAIEAMAHAAEFDPHNAETLANLGLLLKEARRHEEAVTCLRRSLELDPKRSDSHNNLAVTLLDMNRLAEAEARARAAATLDPKNALAWNTIGVALQGQNRMADAVHAYRRVLKLEPNNAGVYSNMLFCMSQMEGVDAKELFAEHLRYAKRVEAPLRKKWRPHANPRDALRRLRIGFLSGDLRNHAVASFVEPIFERLAHRPGVSLHAYHNHLVTDNVTTRFQGYMTEWANVVALGDDELAERIRADGIDILVDLSGHTAYNRLPVLARKPAPIQVTWIGYPGTTGLQAVDYYLTDRNILPPGQFDHQFSEKLVHLPVSCPFQPELDSDPISPLPALENGYITFGSFNRISKIGRKVVAAWGRLLRALPDSKLLLGGVPPDGGADQIIAWLEEEGVDGARVRTHPRCGLKEYLTQHGQVDINLDAFPYSGGTTTLHALWMGVPTLTLAGDTAAGRQSACILEHVQLPQFIAEDVEDFVRKGLAACADLDALSKRRHVMRDYFALPSSSFMTTLADWVESALRTMWQRWCDGLPPASFEIAASPAEPVESAEPPSAPASPPIYVTQPAMPPMKDFVTALEQIWESKCLTNGGQFHQRLEQALCEHLGVEHISLFANGTLALMTALQALGIDGEVITTPYSFVATSHALLWNGLKPVFADIDPVTFNLDPAGIEAAITPATRAIMPVHCYGNPCDVERIEKIARKHGLKVIYDAAHAFGVRQDGQSILRHGDLSVLSFHATKVFNTFEGGAIVCKDAVMKKHIDDLKNFGIVDEVTVIAAGINGKMHEVSAAFGLLQLKGIDEAIAKRKQIAATYRRILEGVPGITCMAELGHASNFGYFPILVDDAYRLGRDGLYQKLRAADIHARRYFYPLISELPMYREIRSADPSNLPIATVAARQVLCLPIYPALEAHNIERIIGLIKSS